VSEAPPRPKKARALSELVAGVLAPVSGKRAYVLADLTAAWPEIAGPRYADCTQPDRIDWPRNTEQSARAVLRVRAEGPRAVLLQHELGQLAERVNAFLGYGAIEHIRVVQGPVARRGAKASAPAPAPADEARVAGAVADVADDPLKAALARLGRGVFAGRR
jgi:hypothetical protein